MMHHRRASSTDGGSPRRRRGGGGGKGSDPGSPSSLSVSFNYPSGENANDGREDGQRTGSSSRQLFADGDAKTGRQGEPASGASGNEGTATEEEGFEGEDEVFAIKNLDTGEAIHISEVGHLLCILCPLRKRGWSWIETKGAGFVRARLAYVAFGSIAIRSYAQCASP